MEHALFLGAGLLAGYFIMQEVNGPTIIEYIAPPPRRPYMDRSEAYARLSAGFQIDKVDDTGINANGIPATFMKAEGPHGPSIKLYGTAPQLEQSAHVHPRMTRRGKGIKKIGRRPSEQPPVKTNGLNLPSVIRPDHR